MRTKFKTRLHYYIIMLVYVDLALRLFDLKSEHRLIVLKMWSYCILSLSRGKSHLKCIAGPWTRQGSENWFKQCSGRSGLFRGLSMYLINGDHYPERVMHSGICGNILYLKFSQSIALSEASRSMSKPANAGIHYQIFTFARCPYLK